MIDFMGHCGIGAMAIMVIAMMGVVVLFIAGEIMDGYNKLRGDRPHFWCIPIGFGVVMITLFLISQFGKWILN